VYIDEQENISDRQILNQLDILNRDFNLKNENLWLVPQAFIPFTTSTEIRFCLAAVGPDGQYTNGITRTLTSIQGIGNAFANEGRRRIHYQELGGQDAWDPTRYLNIWIGAMDGILGFGHFPGTAPFPEEDGIIIDPNYIGSTDLGGQTSQFDRGHTITHEMGHYLNVHHLWGPGSGSCETDDFVDDTPVQGGPYTGCPSHPRSSCGSEDMFMNFMDFTNDHCIAFFTPGQKQRMLATLSGPRLTITEQVTECNKISAETEKIEELYNTSYDPEQQVFIIHSNALLDSKTDVELFDVSGRLLQSSILDYQYSWVIQASGLPAGIYIILLKSAGRYDARKIFKPY
jgi:hypothetical protein